MRLIDRVEDQLPLAKRTHILVRDAHEHFCLTSSSLFIQKLLDVQTSEHEQGVRNR
jgi:hypothetical protein